MRLVEAFGAVSTGKVLHRDEVGRNGPDDDRVGVWGCSGDLGDTGRYAIAGCVNWRGLYECD